jgi:hypothetical protein
MARRTPLLEDLDELVRLELDLGQALFPNGKRASPGPGRTVRRTPLLEDFEELVRLELGWRNAGVSRECRTAAIAIGLP